MNIHSANISSAKPIPVARHLKSNVEEIKFATSKSELGTVLVARSAAGVCAILIGNRADVLKRDLAGEFTDAKLVHGLEHFFGRGRFVSVVLPPNERKILAHWMSPADADPWTSTI